jgi:hypothetical protein
LRIGAPNPELTTEVTVARQSPGRRNAEEHAADKVADREDADAVEDATEGSDAAYDEDDNDLDAADEDRGDEDGAANDTADDRPLWRDVRIDPVEIALPVGLGYTLRAYRPSSALTPTEVEDRDEDDLFAQRVRLTEDDEEEIVILDEEFRRLTEEDDDEVEGRQRTRRDDDEDDDDDKDEDKDDKDKDEIVDEDEAEPKDAKDEDGRKAEATEDEEVPAFLSHRGKLLLFRSAESLVEFVRSGQPNDLAQLDTWAELAERIEPADVAPRDEDSYELDLVVENLRGGHDVWDVRLLIAAGEVARDLGYALRIEPLITALSAGSPLDDLDEALRRTADGGLGGFLGRRRLRKIGAQQATLGWRTIIGKISAAVDWRD